MGKNGRPEMGLPQCSAEQSRAAPSEKRRQAAVSWIISTFAASQEKKRKEKKRKEKKRKEKKRKEKKRKENKRKEKKRNTRVWQTEKKRTSSAAASISASSTTVSSCASSSKNTTASATFANFIVVHPGGNVASRFAKPSTACRRKNRACFGHISNES